MNIFSLTVENAEMNETITEAEVIESDIAIAEVQEEIAETEKQIAVANEAEVAVAAYEAGDVTSEAAISELYDKLILVGDNRPNLTVEDARSITEKVKDILKSLYAKIVNVIKGIVIKIKKFFAANKSKIEKFIKSLDGKKDTIDSSKFKSEDFEKLCATFDTVADKQESAKISELVFAFNADVKANDAKFTKLKDVIKSGPVLKGNFNKKDDDKEAAPLNIHGGSIKCLVVTKDDDIAVKTYKIENNSKVTLGSVNKSWIISEAKDLITKADANKETKIFDDSVSKIVKDGKFEGDMSKAIVKMTNIMNSTYMSWLSANISDVNSKLAVLIKLSKCLDGDDKKEQDSEDKKDGEGN